MPDLPTWYPRAAGILKDLRSTQVPLIDRFTVERLFGLSRRQSIRIMHQFGGYQIGRTFLIHRGQMIAALEGVLRGERLPAFVARKRRVWRDLETERTRVKAQAVEIPGVDAQRPAALRNLPLGVRLEPGELRIQFDQPVDLLQKLYALAQALASDYESLAGSYGQMEV